MAFPARATPTILSVNLNRLHLKNLKLLKPLNTHHGLEYKSHTIVCCSKLTPWEPRPVTYTPTDDTSGDFLKKSSNIFENLNSNEATEAPVTNSDEFTDSKVLPFSQFQFLKWPLWLLGPAILLVTGMAPTLWLPLSSVFLGPNIASFLSLIGLDCLFNLGATLFLLMADACSKPKDPTQACNSKPPLSYKFWNLVATLSGFIIPLLILFGSEKGVLQPQLPSISFAILLGPYLLLLSVQVLTELLTWHWQSPVWLVTPVVYEAYRVLQLMRGLKLGAELSVPAYTLHTIRGLVSWWILILGIQLMRVAWFAGSAAKSKQQQQTPSPQVVS